jgi:broad specificity phosphatase PhoE
MTAIFVLRHPETTWNRTERYQGRLDSPLSALGRRQVKLAAEGFRGEALDCVVTSPLTRSRELAHAIASTTGAPLRIDARLTEIGQGVWEGLHLSEIRARYPALLAQWHSRPDLVRFPRGEAVADVVRRASAAVKDIFEAFPNGTVAVVTHSVVVQVLASMTLHLDPRFLHSIKISNAGVTTLCGRNFPGALLSLNVTAALHGSSISSARAEACAGERKWKQPA